jgi:hypothetical protein
MVVKVGVFGFCNGSSIVFPIIARQKIPKSEWFCGRGKIGSKNEVFLACVPAHSTQSRFLRPKSRIDKKAENRYLNPTWLYDNEN